jgi:hypothetical protein
MTIKYQPQGIIISSSFAHRSEFARDFISGPPTASVSTYAELGPIGPTGSIFKILTGSVAPVAS